MIAPNLLLHNGCLPTVRGKRPATAVAIAADRIIAVGTDAEILPLRGQATTVIDLRGRTLLPGLIDAHCHITGLGLARLGIDLNYPKARSIGDIRRLVAERAAMAGPGTWIRGRGYDQLRLADRRHPTRWDLDDISNGHPVWLSQSSGHVGVANSEALRLAGITAETPDPPGGRIDRRDGEPTGVLFENASELVTSVAKRTREEVADGLRRGAEEYLRLGVTAVHDMSSGNDADLYRELNAGGNLGIRIAYSHITEPGDVDRPVLSVPDHGECGDWVTPGPAKAMLDGSDDSATAGMIRPYPGAGDHGIILWEDGALIRWAATRAAAGWQLTVHAIGDIVIDQALAAMAPQNRGGAARHRVEHCIYPTEAAFATIVRERLIPVVQPIFISMVDEGYCSQFHPDDLARAFPVRSFLDAGLPVAAGSDAPVADPNPLAGMAVAMDRVTNAGTAFRPEEGVTLEQALGMYTRNAAFAAFMDDRTGSIEVGKLADLTVVGADITALTPADLRQVPVDLAIVGGVVRFARE